MTRSEVTGISEIENARDEWAEYHRKVARQHETEDGCCEWPRKPSVIVADLVARYPVAAAWLRAEGFSYAANDLKAGAGLRALERLGAGEDHETVIAEMEAEWSQAATAAVWNS